MLSPELVDAACQGDTEAIETLLLQYQPTLTRFARKYCATPEDVEDAVQETLWVVYQKINTLRSAGAFVSWIFRIVRNSCYRLLHRKYEGEQNISLTRLEALEHSGDADALDDEALAAELKQDLVTAIARLPAEYRQVLILRDLEGFSGPEVAAQLDLTLAAVKSRLHRARHLLRELLSSRW